MYNISEVGVSSTGTLSATEYNFTYDSNGNITQIKDATGDIQHQYEYDDLGQLVREDNTYRRQRKVRRACRSFVFRKRME